MKEYKLLQDDNFEQVCDGGEYYKYGEGRKVIYKIENSITNEFYIGMTINFNKRIISHLSALSKNDHYNRFLQDSFNEYGLEAFVFDVIEEFDEITTDELFEIETKYIKELRPSFNISKNNRSSGVIEPSNNYGYEDDILNLEYRLNGLVVKAIKMTKTYSAAAKLLGISERTLYRKVKEIGNDAISHKILTKYPCD